MAAMLTATEILMLNIMLKELIRMLIVFLETLSKML